MKHVIFHEVLVELAVHLELLNFSLNFQVIDLIVRLEKTLRLDVFLVALCDLAEPDIQLLSQSLPLIRVVFIGLVFKGLEHLKLILLWLGLQRPDRLIFQLDGVFASIISVPLIQNFHLQVLLQLLFVGEVFEGQRVLVVGVELMDVAGGRLTVEVAHFGQYAIRLRKLELFTELVIQLPPLIVDFLVHRNLGQVSKASLALVAGWCKNRRSGASSQTAPKKKCNCQELVVNLTGRSERKREAAKREAVSDKSPDP